jgi:hypothetical protein
LISEVGVQLSNSDVSLLVSLLDVSYGNLHFPFGLWAELFRTFKVGSSLEMMTTHGGHAYSWGSSGALEERVGDHNHDQNTFSEWPLVH